MRIVVTGATGQLGYDAVRALRSRGHAVTGVGSAALDITDGPAVAAFLERERPEAVLHCAAYTAVDAAEDDEARCRLVNAAGTEHIARACGHIGAKLAYISTDYVFDGGPGAPRKPDDEPRPQNVYGRTKYEGELAVKSLVQERFIVRTSWVFGKNGKNFVRTMLRLGAEREQITVVDDQRGSPTYTRDLAALLADMLPTSAYGVYHAANEGVCSWYEFASEIFLQSGLRARLTPVTSDEYPARAVRPLNGVLDKSCLTERGFSRLPDWRDALRRYLAELSE